MNALRPGTVSGELYFREHAVKRIKMQGVDNLVTRVSATAMTGLSSPRLCTGMHGYTVGCYSYYRLLMRILVLKTYPPPGVTTPKELGGELREPLLAGIMVVRRKYLPAGESGGKEEAAYAHLRYPHQLDQPRD